MPIFMKAGSIAGDVSCASHKGWVEISSCSFEVKFSKDGAPLPQLETFDVEKTSADRSGPDFMKWMVDGKPPDDGAGADTVQIDVCNGSAGDSTKDGWRATIRYTLKKAILVDYSMKLNDGEKGTSSISMKWDYQDLIVESINYDKAGKRMGGSTSTIHKPS